MILFAPATATAQEEGPEEITVFLLVRNVGGTELPAYINGEVLYLPVTDLFSFLKIQNSPNPDFDSITGTFISPDSKFLVDYGMSKIYFMGKVYTVNPGDMIHTESNLFLKISYFSEIFGLECTFNFRSFTVVLTSKIELPVLRQMKQEMIRANINKLKGDMVTDTVIPRKYPFFSFGAADWSVSSSQVVNGPTTFMGTFTIGSLLAGGDLTIGLNAGNAEPMTFGRQFWQWHFADNDFKLFKQIYIGKIPTHAVSSIYSSVIGAAVTNSPTTFRRSFGTWIITDYTQPGWIVELYVNYVLVDYTRADASGYFSFEVPLVYGNSNVKLRFYGPWGEEATREQTILIPFNFLPLHKFEYTVSGGMVDNYRRSVFSRVDLFYGLSRRMTIGAGAEYLSSAYRNKPMPFVTMSMRIGSSLILSAEYMQFVRFKGVMSLRLPSNLILEGYYTRYTRDQQAVLNTYQEERKLVASKPIRFQKGGLLTRLTLDQVIMQFSKSFSSELLLSGNYKYINANFTTYAFFANPAPPYVYSELAVGLRLPAKLIITPQLQYVYTMNQFLSFKLKVEKQFMRNGVLAATYDRGLLVGMDNFQIGFRYDLPYAQTDASFRYGDYRPSFIEYARGSVVYKGKDGGLTFSNYSSVGRGGITLVAFLDLNGNGKWDRKKEPKIPGLNLHINGGRIFRNAKDSTIQITDLEPYNKYFIELDRDRFDNIAWRIPMATIAITINPNQYTLLEIPVIVVGEVSGFVYTRKDTLLKGQGGIYIGIYRLDSSLVKRVLTETDGYYSHFGLPPGHYFAMPDTNQLRNIRKISTPKAITFAIRQTQEGDYAGDIDFYLTSARGDTVKAAPAPSLPPRVKVETPEKQADVPKPAEKQDVLPIPAEKQADIPKPAQVVKTPEVVMPPDTSGFSIQVGAFRHASNARKLEKKMAGFRDHPVVIRYEERYHKVRITGFRTYEEAVEFMNGFVKKEVPGSFIHKYK